MHFALLDDDGVLQHSITFEDWFTDYDEVVIKRAKLIEKIKNDALAEERRKELEEKHKEYKQIKLNLQQMKEGRWETSWIFDYKRICGKKRAI